MPSMMDCSQPIPRISPKSRAKIPVVRRRGGGRGGVIGRGGIIGRGDERGGADIGDGGRVEREADSGDVVERRGRRRGHERWTGGGEGAHGRAPRVRGGEREGGGGVQGGGGAAAEVVAGEAEEAMGAVEGVDFLVVDSRGKDADRLMRAARFGERGRWWCAQTAEGGGGVWRRAARAWSGRRICRSGLGWRLRTWELAVVVRRRARVVAGGSDTGISVVVFLLYIELD
ncbi:hypothetical protein Syun_012786 [Stephania yunnanensis]|uniref:Uncharacterized protein n=1 Tax=Stephania yunnanensis TaxID=152371 RepID=A0AAP0K086_9MAGN